MPWALTWLVNLFRSCTANNACPAFKHKMLCTNVGNTEEVHPATPGIMAGTIAEYPNTEPPGFFACQRQRSNF